MPQNPTKRDRNVPPGILNEARRTIVNKVTGETVVWTKYGYETKGELSEAIIDCLKDGGPPQHYHTTYNERFMPVEGECTVFLGDSQTPQRVNPGESVWVPMGMKHRFTAEKGDVKIRGQVVPSSPGFEQALYIMFGLTMDDQSNSDGLPKSLVHTAIVSQMSDMKFVGFGGMIMNALVGLLAWYGRVTGEEERLLQRYWD